MLRCFLCVAGGELWRHSNPGRQRSEATPGRGTGPGNLDRVHTAFPSLPLRLRGLACNPEPSIPGRKDAKPPRRKGKVLHIYPPPQLVELTDLRLGNPTR